jgi:hypothetical protein
MLLKDWPHLHLERNQIIHTNPVHYLFTTVCTNEILTFMYSVDCQYANTQYDYTISYI